LHLTRLGNTFIPDNTTLVVLIIKSPIEKLKPIIMKTRPGSSLGALHPVLFFAVIYAIALLFSIFICSSLFYSCNTSGNADVSQKQEVPAQQTPSVQPTQASLLNN